MAGNAAHVEEVASISHANGSAQDGNVDCARSYRTTGKSITNARSCAIPNFSITKSAHRPVGVRSTYFFNVH